MPIFGRKFGPDCFQVYGQTCKFGDIVGVLLEFRNGYGQLSFFKNGYKMGVAFNFLEGSFCPAINMFYGEVQVLFCIYDRLLWIRKHLCQCDYIYPDTIYSLKLYYYFHYYIIACSKIIIIIQDSMIYIQLYLIKISCITFLSSIQSNAWCMKCF